MSADYVKRMTDPNARSESEEEGLTGREREMDERNSGL